jgi:hypothetical protein
VGEKRTRPWPFDAVELALSLPIEFSLARPVLIAPASKFSEIRNLPLFVSTADRLLPPTANADEGYPAVLIPDTPNALNCSERATNAERVFLSPQQNAQVKESECGAAPTFTGAEVASECEPHGGPKAHLSTLDATMSQDGLGSGEEKLIVVPQSGGEDLKEENHQVHIEHVQASPQTESGQEMAQNITQGSALTTHGGDGASKQLPGQSETASQTYQHLQPKHLLDAQHKEQEDNKMREQFKQQLETLKQEHEVEIAKGRAEKGKLVELIREREAAHREELLGYQSSLNLMAKQLLRTNRGVWVVARLFAPPGVNVEDANVQIIKEDPRSIEVRGPSAAKDWPKVVHTDFLGVVPPTARNFEVCRALQPVVASLFDDEMNRKPMMVVADGQTGSGKSYTMFDCGDSVLASVAHEIFRRLDILPRPYKVECRASEVYLGKVYDRFDDQKESAMGNSLTQLARISCESAGQLCERVRHAQQALRRSPTPRNTKSSRGHFCVFIDLRPAELSSPARKKTQIPSIILVDLAGSERGDPGAALETQKLSSERDQINKERTDFHSWLESIAVGDFYRTHSPLGNFLWPILREEPYMAYICCVRLADTKDHQAQLWAVEDMKRAGKLAGIWRQSRTRSLKKTRADAHASPSS